MTLAQAVLYHRTALECSELEYRQKKQKQWNFSSILAYNENSIDFQRVMEFQLR